MRLIDVDEIKLPQGFFEKVDNVPKFYEWLGTLPTVDAVEVVRCKDCKYYEETDSRIGTCLLTISGAEVDGFCAWGEWRGAGDVI